MTIAFWGLGGAKFVFFVPFYHLECAQSVCGAKPHTKGLRGGSWHGGPPLATPFLPHLVLGCLQCGVRGHHATLGTKQVWCPTGTCKPHPTLGLPRGLPNVLKKVVLAINYSILFYLLKVHKFCKNLEKSREITPQMGCWRTRDAANCV